MLYENLPLNCPGKVFFGCIPSTSDMFQLKNHNKVETVWNLLMEFSETLEEEKTIFAHVFHSPISDYYEPKAGSNFLLNLQEICFKLEAGENVFIHCFGGHGRTGMALASLLVKINKMEVEDALCLTQQICQGPEETSQKNFIRKAFGDINA